MACPSHLLQGHSGHSQQASGPDYTAGFLTDPHCASVQQHPDVLNTDLLTPQCLPVAPILQQPELQ